MLLVAHAFNTMTKIYMSLLLASLLLISYMNKNVYIKFSAHDVFLE